MEASQELRALTITASAQCRPASRAKAHAPPFGGRRGRRILASIRRSRHGMREFRSARRAAALFDSRGKPILAALLKSGNPQADEAKQHHRPNGQFRNGRRVRAGHGGSRRQHRSWILGIGGRRSQTQIMDGGTRVVVRAHLNGDAGRDARSASVCRPERQTQTNYASSDLPPHCFPLRRSRVSEVRYRQLRPSLGAKRVKTAANA